MEHFRGRDRNVRNAKPSIIKPSYPNFGDIIGHIVMFVKPYHPQFGHYTPKTMVCQTFFAQFCGKICEYRNKLWKILKNQEKWFDI